jgi:hypothetical protein
MTSQTCTLEIAVWNPTFYFSGNARFSGNIQVAVIINIEFLFIILNQVIISNWFMKQVEKWTCMLFG